ncbi:MAG: FliH/SctL family protein, partial [Bryobacteraceae bacterium]
AQEGVRAAQDTFRALVGELSSAKGRLREEAEEDAVRLAMAIARRVLHRELTTDPEAILGLVRAAWDRVDARETQRLRLSPGDAATVRAHRAALNFPDRVEVVEDASLPSGSAIFETNRGSLDASVTTQLSEIERGLTDVLARHKAVTR